MSSQLQMMDWLCSRLAKLLGSDASEDIAWYILAINTNEDLKEYLNELLDPSITEHSAFIEEILSMWSTPDGAVAYRKDTSSEDNFPGGAKKKSPKKKESVVTKKKVHKPNQQLLDAYPGDTKKEQRVSPIHQESMRKSQKFVPLFTADGTDRSTIRLPGRHVCNCQAHKHPLVNNCLTCGRVVCEQEGSGPCVFCGMLVCTEAEIEIIDRGSKKSEKLRNSLMNVSAKLVEKQQVAAAEAAAKAAQHKDRLLNYDRSSARRTKVIDDESDYYSIDNKWSSKEEREATQKKKDELHDKKHASRRDRQFTLDIAGRRVIDERTEFIDDFNSKNDPVVSHRRSEILQTQRGLANPTLRVEPPQFIQPTDDGNPEKTASKIISSTDSLKQSVRNKLRLQDRELQEVTDTGMCLSMHQPWASHLVTGIKIHEGRGWYSAHRGRLWIAATAKSPDKAEIQIMEADATARNTTGQPLEFPNSYPTACLLGCVDIIDVMTQNQYREKYPEGESASPYVFICENPKELQLKFPITGKHKIYFGQREMAYRNMILSLDRLPNCPSWSASLVKIASVLCQDEDKNAQLHL